MNPETQVSELLRQFDFDLVRQRKHKIYRNPDGITFVVASTPSDKRASQNALSTLKRILNPVKVPAESAIPLTATLAAEPVPLANADALAEPLISAEPLFPTQAVAGAEHVQSNDAVAPIEPLQLAEPMQDLSEHEWEEWKRHYWRDERLRKKNEKLLAAVSKWIDQGSKLLDQRDDVTIGAVTDAVKAKLRKLLYESSVLFYKVTAFHQGVVSWEGDSERLMPILWASNGRIGVTSCILFDSYLQHEPQKLPNFRLEWNGSVFLFELRKRPESWNPFNPWACVPKGLVRRIQTAGTPHPEELKGLKLTQKQKDDLTEFLYPMKDDDSELEFNIVVPEDNFIILGAKGYTKFWVAKWETDHYGWIAEERNEPPDLTSSDLWAELKNRFK